MGASASEIVAGVATLLAWLAFFFGLRMIGTDSRDPRVHCLVLAAAVLLVRPTMLLVGLDTPVPDREFEARSTSHLLARTVPLVTVWLLVFTVAAAIIAKRSRPNGQRPQQSSILPSDRRLIRLLPLLVCVSVIVTVPFWIRFGGPIGLTRAAKGGDLDGAARVLRAPAVLAAYVGGAVVGAGGDLTKGVRRQAWAAFGVGAAVAYSWGARDAAVFPLLALVGHRLSQRSGNRSDRRTVTRRRAVLPLVVTVIAIGFGLRLVRDVTLTGGVQSTIAEASPVRKLVVANNLTQFDTFMLVVDDTPEALPRGGVGMVTDSLASAVPGLEVGPDYLSPARLVARHYVPRRQNGWPLSAVGDWYLALGASGVVIGALVSGVVAAHVQRWRRRQPWNRSIATDSLTLIWGTTLAPIGVGMTSPARLISIGVPAVLVLVGLRAIPIRRMSRPLLESTTTVPA